VHQGIGATVTFVLLELFEIVVMKGYAGGLVASALDVLHIGPLGGSR
jgi:hypothetical protein